MKNNRFRMRLKAVTGKRNQTALIKELIKNCVRNKLAFAALLAHIKVNQGPLAAKYIFGLYRSMIEKMADDHERNGTDISFVFKKIRKEYLDENN